MAELGQQAGLAPSSSSPRMTWKEHSSPGNKAIQCIGSPLPRPRPVSSLLIVFKFPVGSASLAGSPVSHSQARYRSAEARAVSTSSAAFPGQEVLSLEERRTTGDPGLARPTDTNTAEPSASGLPDRKGPGDLAAGSLLSLGDFSEQESRFSLPAGMGSRTVCVWHLLSRNQHQRKSRGPLPKFKETVCGVGWHQKRRPRPSSCNQFPIQDVSPGEKLFINIKAYVFQ